MSSRDEHDQAPHRRLRVPAALAVAFVGSSVAVAAWYGGCGADTTDPTPDGGLVEEAVVDAAPVDSAHDAPLDVDAGVPADAAIDPRPDARPDGPPPT